MKRATLKEVYLYLLNRVAFFGSGVGGLCHELERIGRNGWVNRIDIYNGTNDTHEGMSDEGLRLINMSAVRVIKEELKKETRRLFPDRKSAFEGYTWKPWTGERGHRARWLMTKIAELGDRR